jgi:hypothetical protein
MRLATITIEFEVPDGMRDWSLLLEGSLLVKPPGAATR